MERQLTAQKTILTSGHWRHRRHARPRAIDLAGNTHQHLSLALHAMTLHAITTLTLFCFAQKLVQEGSKEIDEVEEDASLKPCVPG